jgi:oligopeptidase A
MKNSFMHAPQDIDFSQYRHTDTKPAIDECIRIAKENITNLKKFPASKRTFDNTVLGYTRCSNKLDQVVGLVDHMYDMDSTDWDDSLKYAIDAYTKFSLSISYDKKLYSILKSFQRTNTLGKLETRMLDEIVKSFEDNGIALPLPEQKRLKVLQKRHTNIGVKFNKNITKSRAKNPVFVKTTDRMSGMPQSFIEQCEAAAKSAGKNGYLIKVNDGTYDIVLSSADDHNIRKKVYEAYALSSTGKNHPLMFELLKIRYEMAKILGYDTPSHYYMRNRMVKTPVRAKEFLNKLNSKYFPLAQKEYSEILEFVSKLQNKNVIRLDQFEYDTTLNLYYTSKMFENKFSLDLEELKEYFVFDKVLSCMLDCLSTMYEVTFIRQDKASWHKDVQIYHIHDKNGLLLAEAHCDWFARDNKKGHAWMNEYYVASHGKGDYHVGSVVTNMNPATDSEPCLMTPEQASTMWHEFGHLMHLALTDVKYEEQSMGGIKRDFIEAPSENWTLHEDVLPKYALHYKTGRPLPKDKVEIVKQVDLYNVGLKSTKQHYLALLDLELHSGREFKSVEEMIEFGKQYRQATLPGPVYEKYGTLSTFGHIVSGYISGYYTYKWSDHIQADLFSRFETEGVLNPKTGNDYRKLIMARGDEADPDQLVRDFMGRDPNINAMLKRDNIA